VFYRATLPAGVDDFQRAHVKCAAVTQPVDGHEHELFPTVNAF
jgi:hypothetical protein